MRILVIGTGAIGGFYGGLLSRAGCEVSVLARTDYEQIRDNGIFIRSDSEFGAWHFQPQHTLALDETLESPPDLILLCVKLTDTVNRVALLEPHLGKDTAIALLCNGVEIEAEIAKAFPRHQLISALAFVCVTRTAPGMIWHQAFGGLAIGDYPNGESNASMALAQAFRTAGLECDLTQNITLARWKKCVWNAAFNPLSVLSGGLDTQRLLAEAEPLVRNVMGEVKTIANALGHSLTREFIDDQIEKTRSASPYKTSMLLDYEADRPMETEAIIGNTLRAASRSNVSAPHLETLYTLMRLKGRNFTESEIAEDAPR